MDTEELDPALHRVVRRYSLIVAEERPSDPLSQALGANARHEIAEERRQREESWSTWLQSQGCYTDHALLRLDRAKQGIAKRWKAFNTEHADLQLDEMFNEDQDPPRIGGLLRAAQDAEAAWEHKKGSGVGKIKSAIENFMNTMDNHSYLFSIVPRDDKYTCLITGVLTSITKAFVNHKKIAELFSEALEKIAKDLATVGSSVRVSDTPEMRLLVVELYVAVFSLLFDAMDWYGVRKRRFTKSFRLDYAEDILKNTEKVQEALGRIRLKAEQATQFTVRDTYQAVQDTYRGLQSMVESAVNSAVESATEKVAERLLAAAEKSRKDFFAPTAALKDVNENLKLILGQNATRTLIANGQAQQVSGASDAAFFYTRAEIQEMSAPYLKPYFEDGRSEALRSSGAISKSYLPSEVAHKMTKWMGDSSSSLLWVEGPAAFSPAERQLSAAAVLLCEVALEGENPVPCVSFTPKRTYAAEEPGGMSRQEKVLIAMLYSLAGQLIQILPEELNAAAQIFETHVFASLDGSLPAHPLPWIS
ncbi:Exocyst complex component Sec10 [Madurella fahalii]|uniref:Exocyst complex component Sec10 n=1 Tax=Madurella fahalii TaxID=1157608 RepID=A0ABQ0G3U3_9PEZI